MLMNLGRNMSEDTNENNINLRVVEGSPNKLIEKWLYLYVPSILFSI